jgi:hypothetical protein
MRKNILVITIALVCTTAHRAWAWDGSGSSTDPYLINNTADWKQLADDVTNGETYSGTVFRMTVDIDAGGVSVGTDEKPFSGIFDGDGHTLTYNRGESTSEGVTYVSDICAPFIKLNGATIRHLRVTGSIYSSHMHCAGLASKIGGGQPSTIHDCHVSCHLSAASNLIGDSSFGGLVGIVEGDNTALTITNCTFTGYITGWASHCGGFVGWTDAPVTFEHCMFDPGTNASTDGSATFIRTPEGMVCSMKECYYTKTFGLAQGEAVFNKVDVPEGRT